MLELNIYVFDILNGLSWGDTISRIAPFIADFPIFFLPVFLWWLWIYYTFISKKTDEKITLMHIFYVCVIGMILSFVIKQFIDIDRPEAYLKSTENLLLWKIPEKSFPSDHATISFAFATALLYTNFRRIGYVFIPFVILMNLSRIVVWVHWPLDILAWTLLWISSAIIFFGYLQRLKLVKNLDTMIIKLMKHLHLY